MTFQKFLHRLCFVAMVFHLSGCSFLEKSKENSISPEESAQIEKLINELELEEEIEENDLDAPLGPKIKPTKKADHKSQRVPIVFNKSVKKWLVYYSTRGKKLFARHLNRGQRVLPLMKNILRKYGIPEDMVYSVLIESGFQTHARSRANAVGYWQFMRGTGREYGLRINRYIDQRRDPEKSTEAAAKYMRKLYNQFGSWYLVLAAYNSGHNRVARVVKRYGTKNFWKLAKRRALPRETRNHVPKFVAALIIAHHPERFGIEVKPYQHSPKPTVVKVPAAVSLSQLARRARTTVGGLKKLNPSLIARITPPGRNAFPLKLTESAAKNLKPHLAKLRAVKNIRRYAAANPRSYRVRRGDSLGKIARRYGVRISQIKRANGLRSSRIIIGQRLAIPGRGGALPSVKSRLSSVKRTPKKSIPKSRKFPARYRVRKGDNLTQIARSFGTSIASIKRANSLKSTKIRRGQVLKIPTRLKTIVVRRGDTLSAISNRYRVTVASIKRLNGIRGSKLLAGQRLKLPKRI